MGKRKKTGGRDWKPGQSGNPKGRPRESWSDALKTVGDKKSDKSKKTYRQLVAEQMYLKGLKGDTKAVEAIMNREDGYPRQTTDITTGGEPLPILGGVSNVSGNDSDKKDSKSSKED